MLKYKAEMLGKIYLEIGRFFPSSKTCNHCLFKVSDRARQGSEATSEQTSEQTFAALMNLKIREWKCPKCEAVNDRDINAALNIRDEGLRFLALGISASANGRNVSQPGRISVLSDAILVEI
jgi:putative transposase